MQSPLTDQPRMLLTCWLLPGSIDDMRLHAREWIAPRAYLPSITHLQTQSTFHLTNMQHCIYNNLVTTCANEAD